MAISIESHTFKVPCRAVLNPAAVDDWEKSEAYQDVLGFLLSMNNSVKGKGCSTQCTQSETIQRLLVMLDKMISLIEEYPPIDQPQRYGNKAFRSYYDRLKTDAEQMVSTALGDSLSAAAGETSAYLVESVGNSTRIDYGTGHELSFLMFLTCLFKIGALKESDAVATVNKVFKKYISLCRELQSVYKMEPAGSHGVWSLDDYQFVPFIWGSSQLMMNPKISPDLLTDPKIVEEHHEEFLFLACINYILKVKTGPFAEHSNQLWNISAVKSWTKVNQGLIKMYRAEVLCKFPVIQHVLFGSLLPITEAKNTTANMRPGLSAMGPLSARMGAPSSVSGAPFSMGAPTRMVAPPAMGAPTRMVASATSTQSTPVVPQ